MSTFDSKDLPLHVHNMQVIILGCIVESTHRAKFQQHMQPHEARIQAMSMNVKPNGREEEEMVAEAFRVAIRLWKASLVLGISCPDNRRVHAQDLVMAGL